MKNIQVIDGENAVYDIFAAPDDVFALVFTPGTDIAFVEEIEKRPNSAEVFAGLGTIWKNPVSQAQVLSNSA